MRRSRKLTFGAHERQTPREGVNKVGKPIRVRAAVELPDSDVLVCVFEHSAAIAIDVQIVWGREDGNHRGEFLCWCLPMHRIPLSQGLVINGHP